MTNRRGTNLGSTAAALCPVSCASFLTVLTCRRHNYYVHPCNVAGSNHFRLLCRIKVLTSGISIWKNYPKGRSGRYPFASNVQLGKSRSGYLWSLLPGWDLSGVHVEVIWLNFGLVQDNGREQAGEKYIIKDKTV
jgi:hypothetical protein